MYEDVEKNAN